MPAGRSIWAVGAEALLDSLAQRDLDARQQTEASRQAARQTESDKRAQDALDLQVQSVKQLDESRKRDDERADNAAKAAQAKAEELDKLSVQYAQTVDPTRKQVIGTQILNRGGHLPTAAVEAKVGTLEDYLVRTYGKNPTPQQIITGTRAYEAAHRAPEAPKEPPVPPELRSFLEQFPVSGASIQEARGALTKAWSKFRNDEMAAGRNPSLKAANDYLTSMYQTDPITKEPTPMAPRPTQTLDNATNLHEALGALRGDPVAAPPVVPLGGATPVPAGGKPPRTAAEVPDQEAIARLGAFNPPKAVTPETIALAKQLIAAGK